MSRRQIAQLATIREDYAAAQAAITYLEREWPRLRGIVEAPTVRLLHVQRAARDLEATYVVRLFSEFEGILHNYLAVVRPGRRLPRTAEGLINRAALHGRIPDPIRTEAHRVREFRNALVHHTVSPTTVLTFREVLSRLNRFLAPLPDPP